MTLGVLGRWALGPAQRAALAAMPDVATILRSGTTRTAGGYSQSADPWPTVGTTRCRLTTSLTTVPAERNGAMQLVSLTHWMLTVPSGTDIKSSDRIQCQGATFEVLGGFQQATLNITDTYSLAEIQR